MDPSFRWDDDPMASRFLDTQNPEPDTGKPIAIGARPTPRT